MKYSIKIILINLLIALLFVTLIELIFGYWFDKDNFGPYLREHRLKKNPVVLNYGNETYDFIIKEIIMRLGEMKLILQKLKL